MDGCRQSDMLPLTGACAETMRFGSHSGPAQVFIDRSKHHMGDSEFVRNLLTQKVRTALSADIYAGGAWFS